MERGSQEDVDRESAEEQGGDEEESAEERSAEGQRSEEEGDNRDSAGEPSDEESGDDKDSPGPSEPTEEEKEKQREEDARAAQERLDEVRDAPPEEHAALKADALGSTIVLIGALFVIFGVIVALAFSPWGWAGVAVGVIEIIVGLLIRRGEFGGSDSE